MDEKREPVLVGVEDVAAVYGLPVIDADWPRHDYPPAKLTENARFILRKRILRRDARGQVSEIPDELWRRVADAVAVGVYACYREAFELMMSSLAFLPNSPTLTNAGKPGMCLSACFVLPVDDSMESIGETWKRTALVHKEGGGTGFSGARIRPSGSIVGTTGGVATGPVGLLFGALDGTTEWIKQGSTRRGANLGALPIEHPDILKFVRAKGEDGRFRNFNFSVAVSDHFMCRLETSPDEPHVCTWFRRGEGKSAEPEIVAHLRHDGSWVQVQDWRHVGAFLETADEEHPVTVGELWAELTERAHAGGDPGVLFIDHVNRENGLLRDPENVCDPSYIETTNPCGEQSLVPFESCNLGSVNLALMVTTNGHAEVDWGKLERTVRLGVRFLNAVIDANTFPLPEIEEVTRRNRKVGLGVMGWADLLMRLGIPYDAPEAWHLASQVAEQIWNHAWDESFKMAEETEQFSAFDKEAFLRATPGLEDLVNRAGGGPRNLTVTTVAPTGTLSTIAGVSSGIEPVFAWAFAQRRVDSVTACVHPLVEEVLGAEEVMRLRLGAAERCPRELDEVERVEWQVWDLNREIAPRMRAAGRQFVLANEVPPDAHLNHQVAWQRHVDNAISKTINLPPEATVEDVDHVYRRAWHERLKGVTVYRDGSRTGQPLSAGRNAEDDGQRPDLIPAIVVREKVETTPGQHEYVYVTVGLLGAEIRGGRPYEVFVNGAHKADERVRQELDALTRLSSVALRFRAPPNEVVKHLERVHMQHLFSIPRKLGHAIQLALDRTDLPEAVREPLERCSELLEDGSTCGGRMISRDGCRSCTRCNASRCG